MARAQYWRDNQIEAGTNWWDEIRANLESAEIVLFFISQGFLDSKFIASDELPPALARLEKKEARLIPIILSVRGWQESPIGKLNIQALPRSAKAVLNWDDKTEALLNIAEELNKIIDKLAAKASSESFSQLAGAASTSGTRLAMNEFQETFTASSGQASAIADYKDVHELLHQLKFECLEMLKVSAFRFPERQALRDARNYASTFRDKVDAVAAIAERMLPPDPYVKMISASLKTLRETIQTALDKSDRASLDRFIRVLESGLATWPTGIAIRVNRAAQNLRLPDFIAAMASIGGRLGPSVLDFERGGSALNRLNHRLTALESEHDRWQSADAEFRAAGDALDRDLLEFEIHWENIRQLVEEVCSPDGGFRPAMRDAAKAITAAIAANDSGGAQDKFAELNHEAGQRFLQVDKDLKALTDELRQLDGPLQGVVSAIRQAKSDA